MNKNIHNFQPHFHKQNGIALVSSLLLLLAITLVGVTSLRMNVSSEEMAGNAYIRDQAFQYAQLGLQYGEGYVTLQYAEIENTIFRNGGPSLDFDNPNPDANNCVNGICIPVNFITGDTRNGQWVRGANDVWSSGNSIEVPAAFTDRLVDNNRPVPAPPRFIIEFLGHTQSVEEGEQINSSCDNLPRDGVVTKAEGRVDYPFCLTDPRVFRITALGSAGSADNPVEVMLQSTIITP